MNGGGTSLVISAALAAAGLVAMRADTTLAHVISTQIILAQTSEEPVGWPYRPPEKKPVTPMPVPAKPAIKQKPPAQPTAQQADGQAGKSPAGVRPDNAGKDETLHVRPENEIGPIERIFLPARPLDFIYEDDRIALTRDETIRLMRMAERLRKTETGITIVSWAPIQAPTPRAGLEIALTRALYVRSFLQQEGISLALIDLKALPATHFGRPGDSPYGQLSITPGNAEKMHRPQ